MHNEMINSLELLKIQVRTEFEHLREYIDDKESGMLGLIDGRIDKLKDEVREQIEVTELDSRTRGIIAAATEGN